MNTTHKGRRGLFQLFGAGMVAAAASLPGPLGTVFAATERRPNVLVIISDDQGWNELGCFGSRTIRSPNLDALASGGVRFTQYCSASPVCSPTRGALMTGRYPQRNGMVVINGRFNDGEVLLPEYLKAAGYATGAFGKWHLSNQASPGHRPTERGFDEFYGYITGGFHPLKHTDKPEWIRPNLFRGLEPVAAAGWGDDLFADEAAAFIRRNARRPWFAHLAFHTPHEPNIPSEAHMKRYGGGKGVGNKEIEIMAMDAAVGRVLQSLVDSGVSNDTLVIFVSDNGADDKTGNLPLRGGKFTLYEGGIRVPAIARWPGCIPAGVECGEPLMTMDLFALALHAAGVPIPDPAVRIVDGKNPLGIIQGGHASLREDICFEYSRLFAIRRGRHKLVGTIDGDRAIPGALYDFVEDRGEQKDLSSEKPETVTALHKAFQAWRREVSRSQR